MKKVLILSQPLHTNYGGLLQAYALQKVVRSLGFDVKTDRIGLRQNVSPLHPSNMTRLIKNTVKNIIGYNKNSKIIAQHTDRFIDKHIKTAKISYLTDRQINKYDIFIVGSDQVFRKPYSCVRKYFLEDLKDRDDKIKIAYSASFGVEDLSEWTKEDIRVCKTLALKFNAVSVREDTGVEIFRNVFQTQAKHVLDPTMLLNKEDYLEVIEPEDKTERDNILMCYILDKTEDKQKVIDTVKDKLKLTPLEIMPEQRLTKQTKDVTKCIFPSVSKWIAGFRDAKFVVTDSFHGTVFAIIFNKPFICLANPSAGLTRIESLLKLFNIEDRLIYSSDDISDMFISEMDFQTINNKKKFLQKEGLQFLKNILNK